ncbi:hypothetical protein FSB78_00485 [Sphingomonas ginsenosidivorax]|uniref:Uncharacterized protein n=1 Tax=Sphingomonas ginsenosidivorax TaxID=862135 RepID=A0A5C6UC62_9SPHN|nr:hypothetical protein [Sphingomonas ginsenosidivorax]TXC69605.1 hypothetical protein FSB78_00485 [Sphingomonas ginsenosidivorax]
MTRTYPFNDLFDLPVGGEMIITPNNNEAPQAALERLKLRACKWKAQDRAYRMRIDGSVIRAQRTPPGRNGKLSDWLLMKAGDRLLLKTKPTVTDIKKAWGTAVHLSSTSTAESRSRVLHKGMWHTALDTQGRLFALCVEDRDGVMMPGMIEIVGPSEVGWFGEWP